MISPQTKNQSKTNFAKVSFAIGKKEKKKEKSETVLFHTIEN